MLSENQKNLAKQIGQLNGAIIEILPEEHAQEFAEIIAAETVSYKGTGNEAKDIAENVVDVLDAIADNLPDSTNPKKQKSKNRFKKATNFFKSLVGFFNI